MTTSKACGKTILFGEHAVVYNQPGIAVPIKEIFTEVTVKPSVIMSIKSSYEPNENNTEKLHQLVNHILNTYGIDTNLEIKITSNFKASSGLGSSASLSVALIRSISSHFKLDLDLAEINKTAYDCEKFFHETPSGIDNTVITYEKPIIFHGTHEFISIKSPFYLMIMDGGSRPSTSVVVKEVRANFIKNKEGYTNIFNQMGVLSMLAKECMETGDLNQLGKLMSQNHQLLKKIGVSTKKLNGLVDRATNTGALGAKLVGAGKGGNIVALYARPPLNIEACGTILTEVK